MKQRVRLWNAELKLNRRAIRVLHAHCQEIVRKRFVEDSRQGCCGQHGLQIPIRHVIHVADEHSLWKQGLVQNLITRNIGNHHSWRRSECQGAGDADAPVGEQVRLEQQLRRVASNDRNGSSRHCTE